MRVTIQKSIIENILVHIQPFLEKKILLKSHLTYLSMQQMQS